MNRKRIAPDGSCLFTSVDFLATGEERAGAADELRLVCVTAIKADPIFYTIDQLGEGKSTVEEYCDWLLDRQTYGGGNETKILAMHYNLTIVVWSCIPFTNACMLARYTPTASSASVGTVHLLYTGQHYDAIVSADGRRIFGAEGEAVDEAAAQQLAQQVKDERELELRTRIRKRLQCSCGAVCTTSSDWQAHCEDIHSNDAEFDYLCTEIEVLEVVATEQQD